MLQKWNTELEQIAKWKSITCAMEKVCVRASKFPEIIEGLRLTVFFQNLPQELVIGHFQP